MPSALSIATLGPCILAGLCIAACSTGPGGPTAGSDPRTAARIVQASAQARASLGVDHYEVSGTYLHETAIAVDEHGSPVGNRTIDFDGVTFTEQLDQGGVHLDVSASQMRTADGSLRVSGTCNGETLAMTLSSGNHPAKAQVVEPTIAHWSALDTAVLPRSAAPYDALCAHAYALYFRTEAGSDEEMRAEDMIMAFCGQ
jgi:hypothetical protein